MAETTITEIAAALREAGIDFTREHRGADIETVIVTAPTGDQMAMGPNFEPAAAGGAVSDGIDIGFYSGGVAEGEIGLTDWVPTTDELVRLTGLFLAGKLASA